MPRFCANLTWLFAELPFMERFAAAKEAGFDAVEVLFPYDVPVQEVVDKLVRHGLTMVLINGPPPNYTGGAPGYAAVPGSEARFRQDFRRVLRYARALKVEVIHLMAGYADGPEARAVLVENLRWAAAEAPTQTLTIEPLNQGDQPGYALSDFHVAAEIVAEVAAPTVGLQFDTYHAGVIHGDAMAVWEAVRESVRHVQIGQTPGRTAPLGGPIDFPAFFDRLDAEGYAGWVSAEYDAQGDTAATLGWLPQG